jgi:hypothetical protein
MAVTVWFVRETELNPGRLGPVEVEDDLAGKLIKKGDALALGEDLYHRHHEWQEAEESRIRKAAEAAEPEVEPVEVGADKEGGPDDPEAPPKRRGRPPKARPDNGGADDPANGDDD